MFVKTKEQHTSDGDKENQVFVARSFHTVLSILLYVIII